MLSRGRRAALTFPFLASVCLALCGFGAPAEGSYGVWRGGGGPHLATLDPEGNRTSTTTPKLKTTTFEYDELGKLTRVTQPPPNPAVDPTPLVTAYAYDENRNRIRQTDANGHVVTMEYDELNRLKKTTQDPGGLNLVTETVQFDENGNPLVVRDPKEQTITSTFDELNRLKTKTYAFAQGDATRPWRYTASMDYGYDENSNVLTTDEHVASGTDPPDTTLTTTRTYDGLDRLASEAQPLPDGGSRTVAYGYYKNGLRKTVTDPADSVTQYAYDGQNRLQTAVTGFGTADAKTTAYTYWPDDLLKTVTYPNGVVASHGYDRADRLRTLENAKGAAPVSSYAYTYDPNGNRLSQIEVNAGQTETTGYTYDDLDRLASVTYPVDAAYPQGRVVTYGYDAVGNRIRETEKDSADALLTDKQGDFDHANRLTELQDLVTPAESTSFTWDQNGNQLTKTTAGVTTENRYDLRDKLVEVVQGASTLGRFQYDAQGRRSLKIGEEGLRQYVYDQTSLFAEYDAAGSQKAHYSYGSDRLISLTRADEGRRYFSLDGLRSVVNLTDDLGNVAASYHLSAWGEYRFPSELDASRNRFGFTGHIFDTETELYYAKARYFDPKLGRFLTQDSFLGQIDNPPSLHRYFYGYANPVRYVDRTGFAPDEPRYEGYEPVVVDGQVYGVPRYSENVEVRAALDPAYAVPQQVGAQVAPLNRAAEVGVRVAGVGAQGTAAVAFGWTPAGVYFGVRAADEGQALARELWTGEATQSEAQQGLQIAIRSTTGTDQQAAGLLAGGALMVLDAGVGFGGVKGLPKSQPATRPLEGIVKESRPGASATPALDGVPTTTNPETSLPPRQPVPGDPDFIGPTVPEWKGPTDYGHIKDPSDVVKVTKPTPRQVAQMKAANKAQNEGLLRDDQTGELMVESARSKKNVKPPPNEAQVDHKKAASRGGTRAQTNLELRTRKSNREKSDKDVPGGQ